MENNFFENLKGLNCDAKSTNVSAYLSFNFDGCIKLERGVFSLQISFYARIYETKHKGVIGIDDWDVHDTSDYMFDGLGTNITKLKEQIANWSFESVIKKLDFTNEEQKRAICMAMLEDETLKKVFGKKFKVWELLSVDEQKLLDLQLVVEKFESIGEHLKQQVATHYKIGVQPTPTPTLEEFELKLAELSK
jgi:hypothetical protein